MPRLLLAVLLAWLLTGCATSTRVLPPLAYAPPPIPAQLLRPCPRSPIQTSPDGSLTSAGAELALRARDVDLAQCELLRQLAVDSWPGGSRPR